MGGFSKVKGGILLAIIQARMGSSRFPKKVLKGISGKPLLWHVVNRVRHSRVDGLVIATTTLPEDDLIIEFAEEYHISTFRGSVEDVLDRYYQAAKQFKAKEIVRICGDSPLVDSQIIDQVIQGFSGYDYFSNCRTFPEGLHVEVLSFEILERAWKEAKKPSEREHITSFIYNNPQRFKLGYLDKEIPPMRLVVDHPCDLELVRKIYKRLWKGNIFYLDDICRLFKEEPQLLEINKGIPKLEGYKISLRRDANESL